MDKRIKAYEFIASGKSQELSITCDTQYEDMVFQHLPYYKLSIGSWVKSLDYLRDKWVTEADALKLMDRIHAITDYLFARAERDHSRLINTPCVLIDDRPAFMIGLNAGDALTGLAEHVGLPKLENGGRGFVAIYTEGVMVEVE